jgi:hypothetical protein
MGNVEDALNGPPLAGGVESETSRDSIGCLWKANLSIDSRRLLLAALTSFINFELEFIRKAWNSHALHILA